jgi:hypothetical protein
MNRECLLCGNPDLVIMNLGNRFDCLKCGFRLFPEIVISPLAYVMPQGKDLVWHEVPKGCLAVFREVEI